MGADYFRNRTWLDGLAPTTSGSNIGATAEVGEPSQSGVVNSVWWQWAAPHDGTFTIDTKNSNFDTWLSLFAYSEISDTYVLTLIASDDDSGGNRTSLLTRDFKAGETYYIAVDGFGSSTGNIQLKIVPLIINGTPSPDNLTGTAYPETINGLASNDTINGAAGNDTLNGNEGADQLIGGLDNDIYIVDNTGDVVTELAGQGTDEVRSTLSSYTLPAEVENFRLESNAPFSYSYGNSLPNTIVGNQFNNSLYGNEGADQLIGKAGNDNYFVGEIGDVVIESPFEGIDWVHSSITYTLPAEVENLYLNNPTGGPAINGTGNSLDNIMNGDDNNNTLNGGGGSDTLNGWLGQDILTGGTGTNTFVFPFGGSLVSAADHITDFEIGSSKIDLLTYDWSQMSAPSSFSRAANSAATILSDVVAQVFIDADGGLAGSQALGTNNAALIVATNGSIASNYLVINDATAGFQANKDLVIKLTTGGTLPPVGAIPVTNFFV